MKTYAQFVHDLEALCIDYGYRLVGESAGTIGVRPLDDDETLDLHHHRDRTQERATIVMVPKVLADPDEYDALYGLRADKPDTLVDVFRAEITE